MERRDYLTREIEKLTALIKKLLGLIEDMSSDNFDENIQQINNELIEQFGYNLHAISNMSNAEFLLEINELDELNLELFADLLSEISKKTNSIKKNTTYNPKELGKKSILLLDYIDIKTRTFSLKRMALKKEIQQLFREELN